MSSEERGRETPELTEVKLFVPDDLYRAFQRCVWILINETGRDQRDIMREVVRDFLVKHGC
ncbi:MAG: hypothetical protein C4563_08310 [Desulfobulbus sp.]|jgi:hypothetical protein|nr:MAG: hypothetical protein C4563_08310 [Desulfobulbus sp.]